LGKRGDKKKRLKERGKRRNWHQGTILKKRKRKGGGTLAAIGSKENLTITFGFLKDWGALRKESQRRLSVVN